MTEHLSIGERGPLATSLDLFAIEMMDTTPCDAPFTDAAWVFALLPHGYRMLGQAAGDATRLRSPRGADTTARFAEIADAMRHSAFDGAVFDGEICAYDPSGRLDRGRMHRRAVQHRVDLADGPLSYCVYDLLVHHGRDLRDRPWYERRALLESMQIGDATVLRLQRALPTQGEWLYRQAQALGSPGIAAMRRDAPYRGGMSSDWRWIACGGSGGGGSSAGPLGAEAS